MFKSVLLLFSLTANTLVSLVLLYYASLALISLFHTYLGTVLLSLDTHGLF